jgi:fructose-bisphosphate aldolase class I
VISATRLGEAHADATMSGVIPELRSTAQALVAPGKGILAADESTGTIKKRFDAIGLESTADRRRAYREMLFTTPGAAEFISGVILYDETIRQSASDGRTLVQVLTDQGVIPGIKVDQGAKPLALAPGELVTEGLDGLRERLAEYRDLGARFAKWRAVITIGADAAVPSAYCIDVNVQALARYAALCQEAGIVPIVEPEVLMDGSHTIGRCAEVTTTTLRALFAALAAQRVALDGMLLKPNMVVSGAECPVPASIDEVADATIACFRATVPAAVPGIVFLSGGQSDELATAHLDAMNRKGPHPWELSFSYGRALQAAAIAAWGGSDERVRGGQAAFLKRARLNGAARFGAYGAAMERTA